MTTGFDMDYSKKSLIANRYNNIPSAIAIGGRTYRKYVNDMLLDDLLDKLESFNPKDFVDFIPYIVFLQLGMNYSIAVGLSQITVENTEVDKLRLWLIEQCKQIHEDSLTATVVTEQPNNIAVADPVEETGETDGSSELQTDT